MFVSGDKNEVRTAPNARAVRQKTVSRIRARAAARVAGLVATSTLVLAACSAGGTEPSGGSPDPAKAPAVSAEVRADALAFTASTLAGKKMDVSSLAGEPVVLWFWAPWCTICRAEAPDVAKVAAELDGRVRFLGVPGIGQENDMRAFVKDTGTGGFDHLVDSDGSLWQRFGVVSQPAFAFVAPDGSVQVFAGALDRNAIRQRAESLVVKG